MSDDKGRTPEPTQGTDEEGEISLNDAVDTGDRASWVHSKKDKPENGGGDHPQPDEG